MTRILLVRHGNSILAADGDGPLTPQGVLQSRHLGRWLARTGHHPDVMFSGPLVRQTDTARHVIEAAGQAGHGYPPVTVFDDFAEFSVGALMQYALPHILEQDAALRHEVELAAGAGDAFDPHKLPLSAVQALLESWAEDRVTHPKLEPFSVFEARVRRGLGTVAAAARGKERAIVVTSAGPIGVVMRVLLALPPLLAITLGRAVINSSVTEVWLDDGKLHLISFNAIGHLNRDEVTTLLGPTARPTPAGGRDVHAG